MDNVSDVKVDEVSTEANETETKTDLVKYETYARVLKQHKESQSRLRELEQQANQLRAEREAEAEAKLAEQKKWQELAEKRAKENEELKKNWEADQKRFVNQYKLSAFNEVVGGLKKSEYAKFVDLDKIEVDEYGQVVEESVKAYAQEFRKDFADLVKTAAPANLPNAAPRAPERTTVDLSKMSVEQLKAHLAKLQVK